MPSRPVPWVAIFVSWIAILGIVAVMAFPSLTGRWRKRTPQTPQGISAPTPQFTIQARYVLGVRAFFPQSIPSNRAAMLKQIEDAASNPADTLRAIAVEADLQPDQPPLDRLDDFIERHAGPLQSDAQALRTIYTEGRDTLTPEQRDLLVKHHAYFGRLMLAYREKPADADRAYVDALARRTLVAAFVFLGGAVILGLAGFVLLIILLVRLSSRKFRFAYWAPPFPSSEFLESFALYLSGFLGFSILLSLLAFRIRLGVWSMWVLLLPVSFAALWPRIRGVSWAEWRYALGWHTGKGVLREIGAGAVGYLVILPVYLAVAFILALLAKRFGAETNPPIPFDTTQGGWAMLGFLLLACVWAPVTEETFFRGALYHHLRGRWNFWIAAVFTSLIFGYIHSYGPIINNAVVVLGLGLNLIRQWRSTIIASMTAHFMHNFLVGMMMLLMAS